MAVEFEAKVLKKKKYDYYKKRKYVYEQAFIIIPKVIAKRFKKGKSIKVKID